MNIGDVPVPDIVVSGVFPVVPDYPFGRAHRPQVVTHRFCAEAANGKLTQRFYMGPGAKVFTVYRAQMGKVLRDALADFWRDNQGPYGAFYFDAPNDDKAGTTRYTCRFGQEDLTLEGLTKALTSFSGVDLVEIPTVPATYGINATVQRFPDGTLESALLDQVQQMFPLIKIQPLEAGYPANYVSDRLVTVGGIPYQPRVVAWGPIEQAMNGESDQASFQLANADRIMTALANDTNLYGATVEFSAFHVGTLTKIDIWKGWINNYSGKAGDPAFNVSATDGLYELGLAYPRRCVSRTCWKIYNNAANGCPYAAQGQLLATRTLFDHCDDDGHATPVNKTYTLAPDGTQCDHTFDGDNGCLAHAMEPYFGGIVAVPQKVFTKDNSKGMWGTGRPTMTSASMVADTIYGQPVPEIYCKITDPDTSVCMPVNALIAAGRDEGDFYCAVGVVGEGPIGEFAKANLSSIDPVSGAISPQNPHKLDGQDYHGWVSDKHDESGLRLFVGWDPVPVGDWNNLCLSEGGAGVQRYRPERAAGTAFAEIRRMDTKGLQLSRMEEHAMVVGIRQGMYGFVWSGASARSQQPGLNNNIWVAVNVLLRALGRQFASTADQEAFFDVAAAIDAAGVCDEQVAKLVGTGTETQFAFNGTLREQKTLKDWLQEILNCCLGYWVNSFGKVKFGIRDNSSALQAFNASNVLWNTLQYSPIQPAFNFLSGQFADAEYAFQTNTVELVDLTHAQFIGGAGMPQWRRATMAFPGVSSKSQMARIITTRLREETGGYNLDHYAYARTLKFSSTILSLAAEAGMVCSLDDPDLPTYPGGAANHAEFRITRWRLNNDWSVDIEGRATHDDIYNLVSGPKPQDVTAPAIPMDKEYPPGDWNYGVESGQNGKLVLKDFTCKLNSSGVDQAVFELYYIDETDGVYTRLNSALGALLTDTTLPYDGATPVDGEWALLESELVAIDAVDPAAKTCTIRRGQDVWESNIVDPNICVAHGRVSGTVTAVVNAQEFLTDLRPYVWPGSVLHTPSGNAWVADYDPATRNVTLCTDLPDLNVGDAIYADVRSYPVKMRTVIVPFGAAFFRAGARASYQEQIDLPFAGVVAVRGWMENRLGQKSGRIVKMFYSDSYVPDNCRLRTLGTTEYVFPIMLPAGSMPDAFTPVQSEQSQSFHEAYMTVAGPSTDGNVATPRAVSAIVPTNFDCGGSIAIGGAPAEGDQIAVTVGDPATDAVCVAIPAYTCNTEDGLGTEQIAAALRDWLNGNEEFAAYYWAEASGAEVRIGDMQGVCGVIATTVSGGVTATPTGIDAKLGVQQGRKYAVAFSGPEFRSELSPLSASTGATGGATRIEIQDVPVSPDSRITTVELYATKDGTDSPLYLVGTNANDGSVIVDTKTEAQLVTPYPGATQPDAGAEITAMVNKDGAPWFKLRVAATKSKSAVVRGVALNALQNGAVLTVDLDNATSDAVDVKLVLH